MIPNILAIAGSDPSGGAGIQADIKSISANGGYAMAVISALTVQNTQGVRHATPVDPSVVRAQIEAVLDDIRVDAIKIGMLANSDIIETVATVLQEHTIPVVLDPVMVARSGDRLLAADAVAALRETLVPQALVLTPNLPEAADLLELPTAADRDAMSEHGRRLLELGCGAVLLKGGHLDGESSPDLLATTSETIWVEADRIDSRDTHGTGCTLSSALAARLAQDPSLEHAMRTAKAFTLNAIRAAGGLDVGQGHGPTDHFFALRTDDGALPSR